MNRAYRHLVLAINGLDPSDAASETALQLALKHNASVTVVDTAVEPSTLSRWFSPNASEVFEMVVADKRKRIQQTVGQFREAGVKASGDVLFGKTSQVITQVVSQVGADLLIRYKKGVGSRLPGAFGNTARNLMRVCPCPILFLDDRPVHQPHVMACVNAEHDVAENQAIVDAAEALAATEGQLVGVYFWDLHGKEFMRGHVSEKAMGQLLEESRSLHEDCFQRMLGKLKLGELTDKLEIRSGHPVKAIPEYCREHQVDVVVMCSASLDHPIQRFLGSTTESVLEELPCALMVVKPHGFKTPLVDREADAKALVQ